MARSHTGHLTGSDAVTSAVFRQYGIIRVDGLDELQDTAAMLARAAPPQGDGVCIYAISGGTGAHLADLAAAAGLRLPPLGNETQSRLHEWIPAYLRVSNPVDNGGAPSADERGRKILDTIVADPNVGVVVCPITGALPSMSKPLARDLVAVAETTDKPICVIWGSPVTDDPAYSILVSSSKVVTFRTFGNCVGAVKAWLDWHDFRTRYRSAKRPRRRAPVVAPGSPLSEHESKEILRRVRHPGHAGRGRAVGRGRGAGGDRDRLSGRGEGVGSGLRPQVGPGARARRAALGRRRAGRLCGARRARGARERAGRRRSRVRRGREPRRPVRADGDVRAGRCLRRGVRRRHVPGAAVRQGRSEAHDRRGARRHLVRGPGDTETSRSST